MATSKEDIRGWLHEAKRKKATHLIVVCDTFDHGDYPVYVDAGTDVREELKKYTYDNMQRVMEVYSMKRDMEEQLAQHRSWNIDDTPPVAKTPPYKKPSKKQREEQDRWESTADDLMAHCLVRAAYSLGGSIPGDMVRKRLLAMAEASNPRAFRAACKEREVCITGLGRILGSIIGVDKCQEKVPATTATAKARKTAASSSPTKSSRRGQKTSRSRKSSSGMATSRRAPKRGTSASRPVVRARKTS